MKILFKIFLLLGLIIFNLSIPVSLAEEESETGEVTEVLLEENEDTKTISQEETDVTVIAENEEEIKDEIKEEPILNEKNDEELNLKRQQIIHENDEAYKLEKLSSYDDETINKIIMGDINPFPLNSVSFRSFADEVKAHLNNFEIVKIYDGTVPFDEDDLDGNDSSYDNKIVRSFDKVVFRTAYSTLSEDELEIAKKGTFYFKAILPVPVNIASFDLKAMEWMEDVTVSSDENRSILEGSINLYNQTVSPRVGSINWVISINQALDDTVIDAPTFFMKLNDDDYMAAQAEKIVVSAKPNINASINFEGFIKDKPYFSVLLELMANKNGKGIKGLEILNPKESISFNLTSNTNQNIIAYKCNDSMADDFFDGKIIGKNVPVSGDNITKFNQVFNSGKIAVNNNTVSITEYKFDDLRNKVTNNADKNNDLDGMDYNDDHIPFGSYIVVSDKPKVINNNDIYSLEITDLTAKNLKGEEIKEFSINDNKAEYLLSKPEGGGPGISGGPAQFLSIRVINPTTKESYSLISNDASRNIPPDYTVYPGELIQISQGAMMYKNPNRSYIKQYYGLIKFDTNIFETIKDNEEYGGKIVNKSVKEKAFYWVGKADKSGWKNEEEMYQAHIEEVKNENGYKLFESAESALKEGYVVVAFLSLCEFENPKYVITWDAYGTYPALKVKNDAAIDKNINKIYDASNPKRVGVILAELEGIDYDGNVYKRYNVYNSLGDDIDMYLHEKDIKLGFIKAKYDDHGNLISTSSSNATGNRNGNWTHAASLVGGSFFVKTYNTYLNQHISQLTKDGQIKEVYNLDEGQNKVFIQFSSGTSLSSNTDLTDNFIITQKIPAVLKPVKDTDNIADKWGIVYDANVLQDFNSSDGVLLSDYAENFHESKTVITLMNNGIIKKEPICQISEEVIDGFTVLTWKISNYPVSFKLPEIHFQALIDENTVNNTNITVKGTINSDYTLKNNDDTIGFKAIRIGGAYINKTAVYAIRKDNPIRFKIAFKNDEILSASSENLDTLCFDMLPNDDGKNNINLDLKDYYLDKIDIKAELYDNIQDDNLKPEVNLFYYVGNQKFNDINLIENNEFINLENLGFIKLNLPLININGKYSFEEGVISAIEQNFKTQKITAIAINAKNIGNNSFYEFSYEYNWKDVNLKQYFEKTALIYNKAHLAILSDINQQTYDSAVSYPFIYKEITHINDVTSKQINGLNNQKVKSDDIITYKIHYGNPENKKVNIKIIDPVPKGTEIILESISENGIYIPENNTVEWYFKDVSEGFVGFVGFKVKVLDSEIKTIDNQASVQIDNSPLLKTETITNPKQSIKVIKYSNPVSGSNVKNGALIEYFITLKNTGGVDVENILIEDKIPSFTNFLEIDKNGIYLENENKVTYEIPILKANESKTVSFKVKTNLSKDSVDIENVAKYGIGKINLETNKVIHHPISEKETIKYEIVDTSEKNTMIIYSVVLILSTILAFILNRKEG